MYPDTIIMCSSDYHIPDADRKTIANARAWFSRCARNPRTTRTHSSYTINISYILYNGVDGRKYRQTIIAQTHTHTQSIFCWMEKRKQNAKMRNGTIHKKFNEKLCVREQRQKKILNVALCVVSRLVCELSAPVRIHQNSKSKSHFSLFNSN